MNSEAVTQAREAVLLDRKIPMFEAKGRILISRGMKIRTVPYDSQAAERHIWRNPFGAAP